MEQQVLEIVDQDPGQFADAAMEQQVIEVCGPGFGGNGPEQKVRVYTFLTAFYRCLC